MCNRLLCTCSVCLPVEYYSITPVHTFLLRKSSDSFSTEIMEKLIEFQYWVKNSYMKVYSRFQVIVAIFTEVNKLRFRPLQYQ